MAQRPLNDRGEPGGVDNLQFWNGLYQELSSHYRIGLRFARIESNLRADSANIRRLAGSCFGHRGGILYNELATMSRAGFIDTNAAERVSVNQRLVCCSRRNRTNALSIVE